MDRENILSKDIQNSRDTDIYEYILFEKPIAVIVSPATKRKTTAGKKL